MAIADITKPMALDETLQATNTALGTLNTTNGSLAKDASLNTTESTPRSIADVLAEELGRIADVVKPDADDVDYDNTSSGLSAANVQDAIDEIKAGIDETGATKTEASEINGNIVIDDVETPVYRNYGNNAVLTTDKTPFLTRQTLNPTGFSGYVREKLVGASYAWNQLNDQTYYRTSASTTVTANAKNGFDASSTAQYIQPQVIYGGGGLAPVYAGHKYLIAFGIEDISHISSGQLIAYGTTLTRLYYAPQKQNHLLIAPSVNGNQQFGFEMQFTMDAANRSIVVTNLICVDLTLTFGSTIADYLYSLANNGGITKLRDMGCPIDKYTPYGYGLYSVKTSGKKIVGKNLLNGVYTNANTFIAEDGTITTASAGGWNLTDYISVVGGTSITLSNMGNGNSPSICWYDSGKNYIGGSKFANTMPKTVALPDNARYIRTNVYRDSLNVAQIEIGTSATTYEPYSSTTYSLGNDELRGKFDLVNGEIVASGDVKESNGEITRVRGSVHLGDVTFSYNSTYGIFSYALPNGKTWAINTMPTLLIGTGRFELVGARALAGFVDKQYSIIAATASVGFKDSGYTDPTLFKNSLNGVYLEYELATPTTEQSTPFADPMSLVGATTEEYIDTRDIPCPVGAERQYMGQSEDVVEIPSTPQSDGVWVQKCYVSGGKAHYVWELES